MDDGRIKKAAALEIGDERGGGLVDFLASRRKRRDNLRMMVPVLPLIPNLHIAHAPLDQPSSNQAARAIILRRGIVHAIEIERFLRFAR